jgi:hypothetical protein
MPSLYMDQLASRAFTLIKPEEWVTAEELKEHFAQQAPGSPSDVVKVLKKFPLLQAHLAWRTGYTPSKWLLGRELEKVNARRAHHGIDPAPPGEDAHERARKSGLMGLGFSGGGIRSATFNLGILQGLAEPGLLRCFDYLSSVSGGGYIHQWFASWSKREGFGKVEQQLIPLPEPNSPQSHPEPIRWLRRYSNYLTPQKGIFTADTWVAVATWTRNTLLNVVILISGLLFLVLLPHLLTNPSIVPHRGPAAAAVFSILLYLFLLVAFLFGRNLSLFGKHPVRDLPVLGQTWVQLGLVIPLLVSSVLFTLLFPIESGDRFLLNLGIVFFVSTALLLALGLIVIFRGGAPLCYLRDRHRTSQFKSVREFWQQPKCKAHFAFVLVVLGMAGAALLAALCGAAWLVLANVWIARLWAPLGANWWRFVLVVHPPLVFLGVLFTMTLLIGLIGRFYEDGRREWLARLGAWAALYILAWLLALGFSLFGRAVFLWLKAKIYAGIPAAVAWAVTSLGGLLAGKSAKTAGAKDDKAPALGLSPLEILALVGPYVFLAGLLVLLAALAESILGQAEGQTWLTLWAYVAPAVLCALFAWRVDINEFSMHAFYRNRLARCYLGASNSGRDPNPFSGFDDRDAEVAVSTLLPEHGYYGPFPIFCTALNLTFGEDLAWQERKAASFAFTPLYSGYDVGWTAARANTRQLRFNGFVTTAAYAYPAPGIHISTTAAISGAAMSPNWGYHTNPATAFLLTLFNVRLGWWLRNPRAVDEDGSRIGSAEDEISPKREEGLFRGRFPAASPHFSLLYLVSELLGQTNDTRQFVYLTDGGHFDNMGLYELVRRRCRFIVICDAEDDGDLTFGGMGMAIRKCRIDFGAEIALDLRPLEHVGDSQLSSAHCVVGTIRYQEDPDGEKPGVVVYIKSSLTGDEPADVLNYKKEHRAFPHDTTLNQWFTESQFESYRRLGHHVAITAFRAAYPDKLWCKTTTARTEYFANLRKIWSAFTPEMKQFSHEHSAQYSRLMEEIRKDDKLVELFDMLFGSQAGQTKWTPSGAKDRDYVVRYCSNLIEFIFIIYLQLKLVYPENLEHPFAHGWMDIFRRWAKIDVVQEAWLEYRNAYQRGFQIFAESDQINLPSPP